MSVITLEPGNGPVFTVNPVAKIIAVVPVTVVLLLTLDWLSASTAVLAEVVVLLAAGLRGGRWWLRALPVIIAAPLAAFGMVLYGEPSGQTYWSFGLARITDGSIAIGLATGARVIAIGLPAVLIFLTIDPTDLADGLAQVLRLPSRFVLGALAGLRTIGLFVDDWRALELSRRARGVADKGRVRRFAGQALALLVLSIRRGSKLATAMEARGFGGDTRRTWARPSTFGRAEAVTIMVGVLVAAAVVTVPVAAGTWNFVLS